MACAVFRHARYGPVLLVPVSITSHFNLSLMSQNKESLSLDESCLQLVAQLHQDKNAVEFVVFGYANVNTLTVVASGAGGVKEVVEHFLPNEVRFGMVRKMHKIDNSMNTRFVLMEYIDENNVASFKKSLVSIHKPQLRRMLQPVHIHVEGSDASDFTEEDINTRLGHASGTITREVVSPRHSNSNSLSNSPVHQKPAPAAFPALGRSSGITVENEAEFKEALHALHHVDASVSYLVASYVSANTIKMIHKGAGSVGDFVSAFEREKMNYGLLRVVDVVDNNKTIKFVLIMSQPDNLPPMQKAKIGTQSVEISNLFRPYHIDIFTESLSSDINEKTVMDKVQNASGSLSRVRA